MKLGNGLWATINKNNEVWTNMFGSTEQVTDLKESIARHVITIYRKRNIRFEDKTRCLVDILKSNGYIKPEEIKEQFPEVNEAQIRSAIQKLMDFFSEFEFEPNYRFVNTFTYCCSKDSQSAKDYIVRYFELTDSSYTTSIIEKMKSQEFENLLNEFRITPSHKVNNRFKLYYGAQGTGKTTMAMQESNNVCMVCHSAMLPSDLMEDFKFVDGKAQFTPSALQNAMIDGTVIVLDEINLLPFESLRFLQSILDGKSEIVYKGQTIKIKDGFKIIGTMNLRVNNCVYALPEPLVDRAEDLKKFSLTADQLIGAIL